MRVNQAAPEILINIILDIPSATEILIIVLNFIN